MPRKEEGDGKCEGERERESERERERDGIWEGTRDIRKEAEGPSRDFRYRR
jgi:hypothetical protein